MNNFIQFSNTLPQLRKKVVFHAVICSSRNAFCDIHPFIPKLIMKLVQLLLLLPRPFCLNQGRIQTVLIPLPTLFARPMWHLIIFIHFMSNGTPLFYFFFFIEMFEESILLFTPRFSFGHIYKILNIISFFFFKFRKYK